MTRAGIFFSNSEDVGDGGACAARQSCNWAQLSESSQSKLHGLSTGVSPDNGKRGDRETAGGAAADMAQCHACEQPQRQA
ncbi:hypothetical protein J056_001270 [Wallemia ichthyophaga EXF-994]|uniref:Uncharacterized protein n=1 Tax=Wallemia ichthyophaga (strain EXF-994 / CBS 113033) TaxID=1299270 RepID=R9AJ11_WALI9|nr:uncharacterized protein J056_001270 [Wallemia ichthyophaga EXF-994]EOR00041.1 hypothetical protein J056_001270 [Wallemia ichthyophaga EXF-994]